MTRVYMWITRWICGLFEIFHKKTTDGSKMMYNSKRMDVDKS